MSTKPRAGLPLYVVPLLLAGCSPVGARTLEVSNDLALAKAVAEAQAGDHIKLAPGIYGPLAIRNRRIDGAPVTVSGKGAHITSVYIARASGWTFDGIEFGQEPKGRVFQIGSSSDISVRNSIFRGAEIDQNPRNEVTLGFEARFSERIEVSDSVFTGLARAGFIQGSSEVRIEHNHIKYVREGFNIAGVEDLKIRGNMFELFYPKFDVGEHPDTIQFWNRRETRPSKNVEISENLMSLGGPRAVQGVFIGCENPSVRYSSFLISRNIYFGSTVHGISGACIDELVIEHNVVVASENADVNKTIISPDGSTRTGYMPRIRINDSSGVNIRYNIVMAPPGGNHGTESIGNVDVKDAFFREGMPWEKALCCKRPKTENPGLSEFLSGRAALKKSPGVGISQMFQVGPRQSLVE